MICYSCGFDVFCCIVAGVVLVGVSTCIVIDIVYDIVEVVGCGAGVVIVSMVSLSLRVMLLFLMLLLQVG